MTDYYSTYDLKHVINASGKMTILGVSKVPEAAIEAQQFGDTHFFEMKDLKPSPGLLVKVVSIMFIIRFLRGIPSVKSFCLRDRMLITARRKKS